MATLADAMEVLPRLRPATPPDAEELAAEARHAALLRSANDAAAELQTRWRCVQVQLFSAVAGCLTVLPASVTMPPHESGRAALLAWGMAAGATLGWLAGRHRWGVNRMMVALPLTITTTMLLVTPEAAVLLLLTAVGSVPAGWLLGLAISQLDDSTIQRTG
jgi:hypothetical protein